MTDKKIYNFQQEEQQILNYYVDTEMFPSSRTKGKYFINKNTIEFIIRSQCNQQCSYCYLTKYRHLSYPEEPMKKEEILHNFNLLLDYIYNEKRNYFYNIDFFAGDLFFDGIFFDLMDSLEKYLRVIAGREPQLFDYPTLLMIPSNLAFVYEQPEIAEKVKEYHKYFLKQYNLRIAFSWSTDGIYNAKEIREKKDLDDEYFNTILNFCNELHIGAHPMTSAASVFTLKENYDWWLEKIASLNDDRIDFQPMMLEVRNGWEWTPAAVDAYLNFLTYAFNKRLELCNNDPVQLSKNLFCRDQAKFTKDEFKSCYNYDFLRIDLLHSQTDNYERINCAMQNTTMINCTNLSVPICHRLAYDNLKGMNFITNEDNTKIIALQPQNLGTYITAKTMKLQNHPKCSVCPISAVCLQGCLGAQYEYSGDLFLPIPSVCFLFTKKIKHLFNLYEEYNLITIAYEEHFISKDFYILLMKIKDDLKFEEV